MNAFNTISNSSLRGHAVAEAISETGFLSLKQVLLASLLVLGFSALCLRYYSKEAYATSDSTTNASAGTAAGETSQTSDALPDANDAEDNGTANDDAVANQISGSVVLGTNSEDAVLDSHLCFTPPTDLLRDFLPHSFMASVGIGAGVDSGTPGTQSSSTPPLVLLTPLQGTQNTGNTNVNFGGAVVAYSGSSEANNNWYTNFGTQLPTTNTGLNMIEGAIVFTQNSNGLLSIAALPADSYSLRNGNTVALVSGTAYYLRPGDNEIVPFSLEISAALLEAFVYSGNSESNKIAPFSIEPIVNSEPSAGGTIDITTDITTPTLAVGQDLVTTNTASALTTTTHTHTAADGLTPLNNLYYHDNDFATQGYATAAEAVAAG